MRVAVHYVTENERVSESNLLFIVVYRFLLLQVTIQPSAFDRSLSVFPSQWSLSEDCLAFISISQSHLLNRSLSGHLS
jgi:hypothetical protein